VFVYGRGGGDQKDWVEDLAESAGQFLRRLVSHCIAMNHRSLFSRVQSGSDILVIEIQLCQIYQT
jgi:hypothetical protein